MTNVNNKYSWLNAVAKINYHNQGHWWVVPVTLLLLGGFTAVQLAPYQGLSASYGDGSLILLGNPNLRVYVLNPIYLFIISNIGGHRRHDDLVLYRLRTRHRLWLGKTAFFVCLTIGYLISVVLSVTVASIPFIGNIESGWNEILHAYYGGLFFAESNSYAMVWGSTIWFALLSWLGLGGVALVTAQITNRAGVGFFVAIALNFTGFIADVIDPTSILAPILDIRRPMLFVWYGEPLSFRGATAYWSVWYIILIAISLWSINWAGGMLFTRLRSWIRGAWLIIRMSSGRAWLAIILFAFISALVDMQITIGAEIDALNLIDVHLSPIACLIGPFANAPLFSLIFLRWLLIFLLFLFFIGETAVRTLWRQHVMLLPRLGNRRRWWFSNVMALAGLSLLYLFIFLGVYWLISGVKVRGNDLIFYIQIFVLYWMNLTLLGCIQLLILLFSRSRNQTLLIVAVFLAAVWVVGARYPLLLSRLPVAQTAILAQLLSNSVVDSIGLLLWGGFFLVWGVFIGTILIQRYEFADFLKYN